MSTTPEELRNLAQKLIAKAVEMEKKPVEKWEPKGGFRMLGDGFIDQSDAINYIDFGSVFPTREAAKSVLASRRLFNRMQCLATELNPSGKVGGAYEVYFSFGRDTWDFMASVATYSLSAMFENEMSARAARDILNRDGAKPPHLEGQP